jgi:hypothetical protein
MENKTGKYFKYAIGEIVLVVIGILIALQINNWNEENKVSKRETLILNELINSIDKDLNAYEKFIDPRLERKNSGLDSLYFYIFKNEGIQDSLFLKFYANSRQDIYLKFDNGPFEALKSTGLDIIRNDSLRTKINNSYTVDLPLYSYFGNELYNERREKVDELQSKFIELKRVYEPGGRKYLGQTLKVRDVLNNQNFLSVYGIEVQRWKAYSHRLEQMRESLIDLRNTIQNELKK